MQTSESAVEADAPTPHAPRVRQAVVWFVVERLRLLIPVLGRIHAGHRAVSGSVRTQVPTDDEMDATNSPAQLVRT
jgi:hypothetical protein